MAYIVFNGEEQGKPHIADNLECQDSSSSIAYPEDGIYVVADADGHGSYRYFRSKEGSRLAVEIASSFLAEFAYEHPECPSDFLIEDLEKRIVDEWKRRVVEHFKTNPVRSEELKRFPRDVDISNLDIITSYGSTLMAAVLTRNYLLALHLGDGRIVVLHHDGSIDQPVPWDPDCRENITTSLCMENSYNKFRHYLVDCKSDCIIGIYLTSDGLEDIHPKVEALNGFFANMSIMASSNPKSFVDSDLDYYLKVNNVVDDVSLAGILDVDRVQDFHDAYKSIANRDYTNYEELIYYIKDRIRSKKLGIKYLQEDIDLLGRNYQKSNYFNSFNAENIKSLDSVKKYVGDIFAKLTASSRKQDCENEVTRAMDNLHSYICEDEYQKLLSKYTEELKEKEAELKKMEDELLEVEKKWKKQQEAPSKSSDDIFSFDA